MRTCTTHQLASRGTRSAHLTNTKSCSPANNPLSSFRPRLALQPAAAPCSTWGKHPRAATPACSSSSSSSSGYVEEFVLAQSSPTELERERSWVRTQVTAWLDEEWTPLAVHADLGAAAADAYCRLRAQGQHEMGSILLGLGNELLRFNYRETFTSAFEVANKVVELVMLRSGCDVCCVSPADKERMDRVTQSLGSSDGS